MTIFGVGGGFQIFFEGLGGFQNFFDGFGGVPNFFGQLKRNVRSNFIVLRFNISKY